MAKKNTSTNNSDSGSQLSFSSASSDKVILILEFIVEQSIPLRLQDIAIGLSMSQSTVLRYLNSLVHLGYIAKDGETLRYIPTYKLCWLSHQILSKINIREIISPFLRDLSREFSCGATVARVDGDELLYLDVIFHPQVPTGSVQRIGKNAPMHVTGSGKLFLASLSDESLTRLVERKGLTALTPKSITTLSLLSKELQAVRLAGFSIDNEECESGIRCVSAPLFDYTNRLAAAISVFASVSAFDLSTINNEIAPKLIETAKIISTRLGAVNNCSLRAD